MDCNLVCICKKLCKKLTLYRPLGLTEFFSTVIIALFQFGEGGNFYDISY